jgi:hypothetical protein
VPQAIPLFLDRGYSPGGILRFVTTLLARTKPLRKRMQNKEFIEVLTEVSYARRRGSFISDAARARLEPLVTCP